jgi:hypothetical protein
MTVHQVWVRPRPQQHPHHVRPPIEARRLQGRLSVVRTFEVEIAAAVCHEQLYDLGEAVIRDVSCRAHKA